MTNEEFNALPIKARRFIENSISCLSCGGKKDLDFHYKNYLKMEKQTLFTLRGGAVSVKDAKSKEATILYPINPKDSDKELAVKLKLALKLHASRPDKFSFIDKEKINDILKPKKNEKEVEEVSVNPETEL